MEICRRKRDTNMADMKSFNHRIRLNLIKRVIPAACVLFLTGCQNLPFPFNGALVTNSTQPAATSMTQPATSTQAPAPGTSLPGSTTTAINTTEAGTVIATAPTKPTRTIALEKFKASRSTLTAEKMSHLWSVESKYPLKTGENIAESNFGVNGKVTTAQGSAKESYAGEETKTDWYLTADGFFIVQAGVIKRYAKDQVSEQTAYDFSRLVEIILTKYSVSEETGTYFVKVTTQDEPAIKELMECLGYRKTEKDVYQGSLYLEALLEESTGHLRAVNYVYKNSLEGFTDNGQITFSDWNDPIIVKAPGQGTTLPESSTTPAGTSTTPAIGTSTTSTQTTTKP